jgi:hypothetical protein
MTAPALALTWFLTLSSARSAETALLSPTTIHLRELARRVTPAFVSARGRDGRKATGALVKITLWRF